MKEEEVLTPAAHQLNPHPNPRATSSINGPAGPKGNAKRPVLPLRSNFLNHHQNNKSLISTPSLLHRSTTKESSNQVAIENLLVDLQKLKPVSLHRQLLLPVANRPPDSPVHRVHWSGEEKVDGGGLEAVVSMIHYL